MSIDIDRDNIKHYIFNETESGQDFVYFSDYLKLCKRDIELIKIAYQYFNDDFKKKFKSFENFRKWFLTFDENALNSYFNQLCKIGETYLVVENRDYSKSLNLVNIITESVKDVLTKNYGSTDDLLGIYKKYNIKYRESGYSEKKIMCVKINTLVNEII